MILFLISKFSKVPKCNEDESLEPSEAKILPRMLIEPGNNVISPGVNNNNSLEKPKNNPAITDVIELNKRTIKDSFIVL